MDTITLVLMGIGLVFWLSQLVAVAFTDGRFIRHPLHKLLWFLVVLFGSVFGAAAFLVWKRQRVNDVAAETREAEARLVAEACMSGGAAGPDRTG